MRHQRFERKELDGVGKLETTKCLISDPYLGVTRSTAQNELKKEKKRV